AAHDAGVVHPACGGAFIKTAGPVAMAAPYTPETLHPAAFGRVTRAPDEHEAGGGDLATAPLVKALFALRRREPWQWGPEERVAILQAMASVGGSGNVVRRWMEREDPEVGAEIGGGGGGMMMLLAHDTCCRELWRARYLSLRDEPRRREREAARALKKSAAEAAAAAEAKEAAAAAEAAVAAKAAAEAEALAAATRAAAVAEAAAAAEVAAAAEAVKLAEAGAEAKETVAAADVDSMDFPAGNAPGG
ncbi:unnamed protein product, partial [Phaeothamnion confervicola]